MKVQSLLLNDKFILGLVIANTLSMFIGGYFPDSLVFSLIDGVFTILFLTEALYKIHIFSFEKYWSDSWNKFDFIITIASLPSLLSIFIHGNVAIRILLALRVARALKSFRLLQFMPNITNIIKGLRLAIHSSLLVTMGAAVVLLLISILTSALFGSLAPDYFRTPGLALYNIFKIFTVEGWYEIPDCITANSNPVFGALSRVYFSLMVFICGIMGMSLINTIFVDAATSDNNDEIKEQLKEIKQMIEEERKNK